MYLFMQGSILFVLQVVIRFIFFYYALLVKLSEKEAKTNNDNIPLDLSICRGFGETQNTFERDLWRCTPGVKPFERETEDNACQFEPLDLTTYRRYRPSLINSEKKITSYKTELENYSSDIEYQKEPLDLSMGNKYRNIFTSSETNMDTYISQNEPLDLSMPRYSMDHVEYPTSSYITLVKSIESRSTGNSNEWIMASGSYISLENMKGSNLLESDKISIDLSSDDTNTTISLNEISDAEDFSPHPHSAYDIFSNETDSSDISEHSSLPLFYTALVNDILEDMGSDLSLDAEEELSSILSDMYRNEQ